MDLGIDEGGAGTCLCVSLHVGDTAAQKLLSEKWDRRLQVAGIECFHSKDYDNYAGGVFGGTSRADRRALLRDLAGFVHEAGDVGLTVTIDTALYDRLATNEFKSQWGAAYSFAAQIGMIGISDVLGQWGASNERVNVIIERGHRNCEQLVQQLRSIQGQEGHRLKINFAGSAPKKGNPILQVADMLAYGFWSGVDSDIYKAVHVDSGTYQSFTLRCREDLINRTFDDIRAAVARRKSSRERRPKSGTRALEGRHEPS
jgi:hypothetical protein